LTELADVSSRAAKILQSDAALPPIVIGKLLVTADKVTGKLKRHTERLTAK
jgi:hypothetical protein